MQELAAVKQSIQAADPHWELAADKQPFTPCGDFPLATPLRVDIPEQVREITVRNSTAIKPEILPIGMSQNQIRSNSVVEPQTEIGVLIPFEPASRRSNCIIRDYSLVASNNTVTEPCCAQYIHPWHSCNTKTNFTRQ